MYYFAYGSCMNETDFRRSVSNFNRLGMAQLHDYKLGFTMFSESRNGGVADIIDCQGAIVEGVLYTVDEEEIEKLDRREGHPFFYKRLELDVVFNGEVIENVTTYKGVKPDMEEYSPSQNYAEIIIAGASEILSPGYLERLHSHIHGLWSRDR